MSTAANEANSTAEEMQDQIQKVTSECSKSIAELWRELSAEVKEKYTERTLRTGPEKQSRKNRRAGANPYDTAQRGSTSSASMPVSKKPQLPRHLSKVELDLQISETLEVMVPNGTFPTSFDVDAPLPENEDLNVSLNNVSLNNDEVTPVDFQESELGYDEQRLLPTFYPPRNVQGW